MDTRSWEDLKVTFLYNLKIKKIKFEICKNVKGHAPVPK